MPRKILGSLSGRRRQQHIRPRGASRGRSTLSIFEGFAIPRLGSTPIFGRNRVRNEPKNELRLSSCQCISTVPRSLSSGTNLRPSVRAARRRLQSGREGPRSSFTGGEMQESFEWPKRGVPTAGCRRRQHKRSTLSSRNTAGESCAFHEAGRLWSSGVARSAGARTRRAGPPKCLPLGPPSRRLAMLRRPEGCSIERGRRSPPSHPANPAKHSARE